MDYFVGLDNIEIELHLKYYKTLIKQDSNIINLKFTKIYYFSS